MEAQVRHAVERDLEDLLSLYKHLNRDDPSLELTPPLIDQWRSILANPMIHYFVVEMAGQLVSSCTITIIPNLTRQARPYGVIENVVTHQDYRGRGLGTRVLEAALRSAWQQGCYKVMLMTGSKREETLRFYERAGFKRGEKTAFLARPS